MRGKKRQKIYKFYEEDKKYIELKESDFDPEMWDTLLKLLDLEYADLITIKGKFTLGIHGKKNRHKLEV